MNDGEKTMWLGYGMMWLAIGGATTVGLFLTHDANCLWALLIGTLVSFSRGPRDGRKGREE